MQIGYEMLIELIFSEILKQDEIIELVKLKNRKCCFKIFKAINYWLISSVRRTQKHCV